MRHPRQERLQFGSHSISTQAIRNLEDYGGRQWNKILIVAIDGYIKYAWHLTLVKFNHNNNPGG